MFSECFQYELIITYWDFTSFKNTVFIRQCSCQCFFDQYIWYLFQ